MTVNREQPGGERGIMITASKFEFAAEFVGRSVMFLACIAVAGCGGGGTSGDGAPTTPTVLVATVASVRLNYASATMAKGQTLTLQATALDVTGATISGKTISWTSDNASIVSVDGTGRTTAAATGAAAISAAVDGKSASSTLTVLGFSAIQPGMLFTCALTLAGRLYCAGTNYGATAKPVGGALRFASLTSHSEPEGSTVAHFCALTSDGSAYCWGTNGFGELGTGDANDRATPTAVSGGFKFASIVAGQHHTCGLTSAGDTYCWGDNISGQLGNTTTPSSSQPVQVTGAPKFVQLESGHFFVCGLTADGTTWCWGRNNLAQLGSGDQGGFRGSPAPVAGVVRFKTIASKWTWACGLTADGKTYCWGDNTLGQLGSVTIDQCEGGKPCALQPSPSAAAYTFVSIAMSQFSTCASDAGKQVWCWGGDMQRQLGAAAPPVGCPIPGFGYGCTTVPVQGPFGFAAVKGSPRSYCGIDTGGIAYCWGGNDQGQLGNPSVAAMTGTPVVFSIDPTSAP